MAEANKRLAELYDKKKDLREQIRREKPGASESMINALYNKRVGAINQEITELT
jgi:hypothetical protein